MSNKRLALNLIANATSFILGLGISFFLTPYVVTKLGSAAYGFIGLSGNFISYMSLVTIALNSMAGRFITIEIHRNNTAASNSYFNSVCIANAVLAAALAIPSLFIVIYIHRIVNLPTNLFYDVHFLFALLFANFIFNILGSPFSIATFARNRLDLAAISGIVVSVLNAILLIALFSFLRPSIIYYGIAASMSTLLTVLINIYFTRKLLPEIVISKKYFQFAKVKELISAGIWNTIVRVGQLLLDGLDLLIANLFIGPAAMGTLAIAKMLPGLISSLMGMLVGVFGPQFTIQFAKNDNDGLLHSIKGSMKIMGTLIGIPIIMLAGFGDVFFTLWMPTQNATQLHILSLITVAVLVFSGSINSIYSVFTVTNKLKLNAGVMIATGFISTLTVFVLLKTTSLGLYAIAGVSTIFGIVRNLTFTLLYGAKCLNQKWDVFYPVVIRTSASIVATTFIICMLRRMWAVDTWLKLFLGGFIGCIISVVILLFMNFNKYERTTMVSLVMRKLARK